MNVLAFFRRTPSLGAAFTTVGALLAAALAATIALVILTERELVESAAPAEALARIRHESLASAIFDRQAILAPVSERDRAQEAARLAHARIERLLGELPAVAPLNGEEAEIFKEVVASWNRRERLAWQAFAWSINRDEGARWAINEELARATHAFNDRLQTLTLAFQRATRRASEALEAGALALSAVALAVVLAGIFFVRRAIIRPLRRLAAAEASVARGRLDVRVAARGLAEVRELTRGFNEMVSALRARADEVRQKQALLARRERALYRRNKELASANAELDAFAYAASHDLRAPLRSIESMARFLREDVGHELDPEARDKLDRIRRAARRLHTLIDSLFEVARAGRDLGEVEEVAIAACVEDALEALQGPIREAGAAVEVSPGLPAVAGDRARLTQVFQNLIGNAVKYSSGPGRKPRIEIGSRLEEDGGVVAVWVRDNGIGIPEDQHQRIFQLFRRLHREGEYEGAGVGLSIVQRAVHAHGGDVSVASAPGRGSTFTVRLPRHPPQARKEAA